MLNSITVLGSSSGRNAGDAALIAGLMGSIDRVAGKRLLYEIPSLRPDFIYNSYENRVRPIGMLPWDGALGMYGIPSYQSVQRTDVTLVYDNMLFDKKLYNPLWNYMPAALFLLRQAKKRGKVCCCYNIGAGPVTTDRGREMLREVSELMDFITVRDPESLDLLREIGVKNPNILITADAAISVAPASKERVDSILKELGLAEYPEFLAVNVNHYINSWTGIKGDSSGEAMTDEQFAKIHAEGVSKAAKELGVPVLYVVTQHRDIPITKQTMKYLDPSVKSFLFTNEKYGHHDVKGVLGRASLLFAMRLHSIILATSALTPAVPLVFQQKVIGYYGRLGLEKYLMHFSTFSVEQIYRSIMEGWSDKKQIKETLSCRIPELMIEADKAAELVVKVSAGEDPARLIKELSSVQDPTALKRAGAMS